MWINDHANQLTYSGVIGMHQTLEVGELAVFFRNNHFSTIVNKTNYLYLLVTDQGYLHEEEIVWEVLNEVLEVWLSENFRWEETLSF